LREALFDRGQVGGGEDVLAEVLSVRERAVDSNAARRRSNPTEAVKRLTSSATGSLKRPDHG
jgi:hypothetical protein